jgi:hypothetical protein
MCVSLRLEDILVRVKIVSLAFSLQSTNIVDCKLKLKILAVFALELLHKID